ncbi:hypothetical protein WM40_05755 [Robbsia andropogonis]|uniref:DUF4189 domain-containing protein n=1 Tax=Robbsia andropogonis TaxID=28092 RepID=A0A0F5K2R8_9BURK|nr:hypothetical protein [Robbsia andropogonis]KKB64421.1 hypothetical protein WM40_05755 [Robbsia andropogonis]
MAGFLMILRVLGRRFFAMSLLASSLSPVNALAFTVCLSGSYKTTEFRWVGGGWFANSDAALSKCEQATEALSKSECKSASPFRSAEFFRPDGTQIIGQARSDSIQDYCKGALGGGEGKEYYWYISQSLTNACMNKKGFAWKEVAVKKCKPWLNIMQ